MDTSQAATLLEKTTEQLGYRRVPIPHAGSATGYVKLIRLNEAELGRIGLVPELDLNDLGEFVAVFTEAYEVVPNEHVEAAVTLAASALGATPTAPKRGKRGRWQYWGYFKHPVKDVVSGQEHEVGFVVNNSMDASTALRFGAMLYLPDVGGFAFSAYTHKHTRNIIAKPERLNKAIDAAVDAAREWAKHCEAFRSEAPMDWPEVMESLADAIPDKYLPPYLSRNLLKKANGSEALVASVWPGTMWDVFRDIVKELWMADVEERTRFAYMDRVHDALVTVKVTAALTQ